MRLKKWKEPKEWKETREGKWSARFSRLLLSFVSPHASVPFCFNGVFSCFHYKTPIKIERTWHAIPRCYTVIAGEPVVVGVVFVPFLSLQAETSERVNERKWNTTHHKSTVNKRRKRSDEREECVLHSLRSFITILFFHHSLHSLPTTEDDWSTVRNGWINSIEISKRSMIPFVLFVYNEWRMNEAWNKEHERNQLFTFIIFLPFSLSI